MLATDVCGMKKTKSQSIPKVYLALAPILVLAGALPGQAHAQIVSGASVCKMIGVSKVTVGGLPNIAPDTDGGPTDLCQLPALDQSHIRFFSRLADIHRKGHDMFGFDKAQKYEAARGPVEIMLWGTPLGTLSSSTGVRVPGSKEESEFTMGMFKDATLDDFPMAAYAHEYGHLLQFVENPKMPLLSAVGREYLLYEALPDLFARQALKLGDKMPTEGFPPRLMGAMREWNERQTFHQPANTFAGSYDALTLQKACEELQKKSTLDAKETDICDAARQIETEDSGMPADKSFVEYMASIGKNEVYADPHRIGIPVASFFVELETKMKVPAFDLLKDGLLDAPQHHTRKMSCFVELAKGVKLKGAETYVPSESMFKVLDAMMNLRGNKKIVSKLRKKYGIDSAIRMADNERRRLTRIQILNNASADAQEQGVLTVNQVAQIFGDRDAVQKKMKCIEKLVPLEAPAATEAETAAQPKPEPHAHVACEPSSPEQNFQALLQDVGGIRDRVPN